MNNNSNYQMNNNSPLSREINQEHDPFVQMYKAIVEPILELDKLSCMRNELLDF